MQEKRHFWKIVLMVSGTGILFTCAITQLYAFACTHPTVAWEIGRYLGFGTFFTPFLTGYWCYLIARNLADFCFGQSKTVEPRTTG